jgi:hypothetical protein
VLLDDEKRPVVVFELGRDVVAVIAASGLGDLWLRWTRHARNFRCLSDLGCGQPPYHSGVLHDHPERQTELVADVTEQYVRLTKAGSERFMRAVPSGLFLAIDRLVNYHLMTVPAPKKALAPRKTRTTELVVEEMDSGKKAPPISTTTGKKATAKKAPTIKTTTAKKATPKKAGGIGTVGIGKKTAAKKTAAKKTAAKKTAAKKTAAKRASWR